MYELLVVKVEPSAHIGGLSGHFRVIDRFILSESFDPNRFPPELLKDAKFILGGETRDVEPTGRLQLSFGRESAGGFHLSLSAVDVREHKRFYEVWLLKDGSKVEAESITI